MMARIKIELPDKFPFTTSIPVRITDINYSGHAGNDSILSMIHEARMQFLASYGYKELDLEGVSMIMADVGIEYKKELFYNELVFASVAASGFSKVGFDIYYKFEKIHSYPDVYRDVDDKRIIVAIAKTGMVCFDYEKKKITSIPVLAKQKLSNGV